MVYNHALADRVREALAGKRAAEKAMFGGLAWLREGKMFVGIVKDELMVRVGPEAHDDAIRRPHARTMDFTGRPMRGYVFVAPPGVRTVRDIQPWVEQAYGFAATLVKTAKGTRSQTKKR